MKWIWNVDMFVITWGSQCDEWQYNKSMIQKACELLYLSTIDTQCCWSYQLFWGGITQEPTSLNTIWIWSILGITWCERDRAKVHHLSNFQREDQTDLTLEETSERLRLKDDVAFALLFVISLHIVTMLNEPNNLLELDAILNGKPIGLENCAS
jgi:hypothetical protein